MAFSIYPRQIILLTALSISAATDLAQRYIPNKILFPCVMLTAAVGRGCFAVCSRNRYFIIRIKFEEYIAENPDDGDVVFEKDDTLANAILEANPAFQRIYQVRIFGLIRTLRTSI